MTVEELADEIRAFRWDDRRTIETVTVAVTAAGERIEVPTFTNEFWTSRQRAAHSLHEISYRACFKPQLPRFFIDRLTAPGGVVYDPFAGRGTTPLEARLAGRTPIANDINPLTRVLLEPRLDPPAIGAIEERLRDVAWSAPVDEPRDLLAFYHPQTLRDICALREHLLDHQRHRRLDGVDRWIRMVAVNRLTGHSAGFFSVYTLPPNQATSAKSQRKINADRRQTPPLRDVRALIARKSRALLKDCAEPPASAAPWRILTRPAADTSGIPDASVDLVVTSPPFLNIVNYKGDNWLRCWFCGIDPDAVAMTGTRSREVWQAEMTRVFHELRRVLKDDAAVAFEVGEVVGGSIKLEETVIPAGLSTGLTPVFVLINAQTFTKTANVWGVANNRVGTNTNRIVVFQKR
jgi:hypothetical protein